MVLSTHVHTDPRAYTISPTVGIKSLSSAINRPGLDVHTQTHTRARARIVLPASRLRMRGAIPFLILRLQEVLRKVFTLRLQVRAHLVT
jgi:hypothetical protein